MNTRRVRYAVVGIGSIAQEAVLPAFQNAANSTVTALVSGDEVKREELGKTYGIKKTYNYDQFDECLHSGEVDAVYIALPNHLHRPYAERAAKAHVHILCEKPLAPNEQECRRIIEAAQTAGVKLMTAYRLHFEAANLEAVRMCESGKLGDVRVFNSVFCQQVQEGNVRLTHPPSQGGGALFDMGVYCINAARYLFRDEPVEVAAFGANSGEKRFEKTDEMLSVMLRFPKDRLASFTVSFGATPVDRYTVVGTKGVLTADPAYEYATDLKLEVTVDGKTKQQTFPRHDQFGPELSYFADCILNDRTPEPSGEEGLVDVQIIEAAYRARDSRNTVRVEAVHRSRRPEPSQEIDRPAVEEPELLHARMPSGAKRNE